MSKARVYSIPVVFNVYENSERDAALAIADILVSCAITQDHRADRGHDDLGPVENWFMPNHHYADNPRWDGTYDEGEEVLEWVPIEQSSLWEEQLEVWGDK